MTRWLLFVYQLPPGRSAPRVAVWRALKRLPGNYLQDGVFVVCYSKLDQGELENLAHDVRNYGGKAVLLEANKVDGEKVLATLMKKTPPRMARPTVRSEAGARRRSARSRPTLRTKPKGRRRPVM